MRTSGTHASRIDEFCKDLKNFGNKIIVFTESKIPYKRPGLFRLSTNLLVYKFPVIQVPRIFFNPLTVILTTILGWYLLRKNPPEIILAAVPEGEPGITGYILSRIFKIPLIMDLRDLWLESGILYYHTYKPKQVYRPNISTSIGLIFKHVFSAIYQRCMHVIVVTESLKDFYIQEYKIPQERISVIPNGARSLLAKMNVPKEEVRKELGLPLNKIIMSYVGVLASYYQFILMFESIYKLKQKFPNFLVLIVGDGSQKSFCQSLVKKLHLDNYIRIYGWVRYERACKYMLASDLGIVPFADRFDMEYSLAQKIYDYMASGVPTIVTGKSNWEISKFFKKTKAGLVCPHDSDEIADYILNLIHAKDVLKTLSRNGRRAILEKYNRERASLEMNKIINSVLLEVSTRKSM